MDSVIEDSRALQLSEDEAHLECGPDDGGTKKSQALKRKNEDPETRGLSQLSKRQALISDPPGSPQGATDLPDNTHQGCLSDLHQNGCILHDDALVLDEGVSKDDVIASRSHLPSIAISYSPPLPCSTSNFASPLGSMDSETADRDSSLPRDDVRDKPRSPKNLPLPSKPCLVAESDTANESGSSAHPDFGDADAESDPTYVLFRMYCPIKEASIIVGKKGETIHHLRDTANVRINVSDNLKGIPERIVSVAGPAENVARAFGLLVRVILDEPENEPALASSKQYHLKVLIPHVLIGFIIGKQGAKFREIEEQSAAKLKAAEQPLPYLTDRILSIVGVADAIHIAVYYVAQVLLEHKDAPRKTKVVYYNPQSYNPANVSYAMMNVIGNMPPMLAGQALYPTPHPHSYPQPPMPVHPVIGPSPDQPIPYPQIRYGQRTESGGYDLVPAYGAAPVAPAGNNKPLKFSSQPRTDEYNNSMVGDVIVNAPVPTAPNCDKYNQDVFVEAASIGLVIGKRGNNIKHVREHSGCIFVKIEPDMTQSLMLGGGKGLTPVRKLTLTGTMSSLQSAIYLINQRISIDNERNSS